MSLLDRGTETVDIFPEEVTVDGDGNSLVKPGSAFVTVRATVQPITVSRDDQDATGYTSESLYRLRLPRGTSVPGMAHGARVRWRGRDYFVSGPPLIFSGSSRTAHTDWTIRRA